MPSRLQQKLLRVLEEKQIWQVGAEKSTLINTRFIFASNKNVEELVKKKLFREDLFYRMNTIVITLPRLRERKDDIPLLINHFLAKYSRSLSVVSQISPEVLALLQDYNWPGNIRELENEIRRICTLYPNTKSITGKMLSENIRNYNHPSLLRIDLKSIKGLKDNYERNLIVESLNKCEGSVSKAAELLECSRLYLYRRIAKLKIRMDGITKK
jgi:transcriptional regulator with PAS, ATPase and Fis domain